MNPFGSAMTRAEGNLPLPPLTQVIKAGHFSISVPAEWKVGTQTDSGDMVIMLDPADQKRFVAVFTFLMPDASKESMLQRWQFADRNPLAVRGPDGREGLLAEGPSMPEPDKQTLALGYWQTGTWVQIAQGTAPRESFADKRALFDAILRTLQPRVATPK